MKKYDVINENDNVEYVLKVKKTKKGNTKYTLCRSNDSSWANPGEKIISALDNGNEIKFEFDKVIRELQYHESSELFILLSAINKLEKAEGKYRLLDKSKEIKL